MTLDDRINDRDEQRIISKMKGDGSEFFAMNHLPPVIRSPHYFPRPFGACVHHSCNTYAYRRKHINTYTHKHVHKTYTMQRGQRSAKVTLTFFSNDTESLCSDRIIDLQYPALEELRIDKFCERERRCKAVKNFTRKK